MTKITFRPVLKCGLRYIHPFGRQKELCAHGIGIICNPGNERIYTTEETRPPYLNLKAIADRNELPPRCTAKKN